MQRLDVKLRAHNRVAVDITSHDVEQRTSTYPLEALQQITRNAIMHRTYEATNTPVRVNWFNDRIEVLSPGGAFGVVNKENFGQQGLTAYRNPALTEAMKTLGYVQSFGVGFAIAQKLLREAQHPPLEFVVDLNYVLVVIKSAKQQ